MKKYIFLAMMAVSMVFCAAGAEKTGKLSDETLRRYAAQMLMVGFKGDSIDANSDAVRYVRDLRVGGIILFDVDLTGSAETLLRKNNLRNSLPTFAVMPITIC